LNRGLSLPPPAVSSILGFGGERLSRFQVGIILNRQTDGGCAFIYRYGQAFSQQIVPQRGSHVIRETGNEAAQLYAVNTPRQGLCNTNAHFGRVCGGKRPQPQI
jgi:hypothetical protein